LLCLASHLTAVAAKEKKDAEDEIRYAAARHAAAAAAHHAQPPRDLT
jgi:hypothetical protein